MAHAESAQLTTSARVNRVRESFGFTPDHTRSRDDSLLPGSNHAAARGKSFTRVWLTTNGRAIHSVLGWFGASQHELLLLLKESLGYRC